MEDTFYFLMKIGTLISFYQQSLNFLMSSVLSRYITEVLTEQQVIQEAVWFEKDREIVLVEQYQN